MQRGKNEKTRDRSVMQTKLRFNPVGVERQPVTATDERERLTKYAVKMKGVNKLRLFYVVDEIPHQTAVVSSDHG